MNIFKRFEGMTFADVKEAVKRAADEHPETAAKLAWGAGVTVFCLSNYFALNKLIKRVNNLSAYARADSINEEQHFCNVLGRINYIAEQTGIDKEAMEEAGSAMARQNWERLGGTDELADTMIRILDIGPRGV